MYGRPLHLDLANMIWKGGILMMRIRALRFWLMMCILSVFSLVASTECVMAEVSNAEIIQLYQETLQDASFYANFMSTPLDQVPAIFENPDAEKRYQERLAILEQFRAEGLRDDQQVLADKLGWYLQILMTLGQFPLQQYMVTPIHEDQLMLPIDSIQCIPVGDYKSAKVYIQRLSQFKELFAQLMTELKVREEKGCIPPQFLVAEVYQRMQSYVADWKDHDPLLSYFDEQLGRIHVTILGDKTKEELREAAKTVIGDDVYNCYESLLHYLQELQQKAPIEAGVWTMPDGEAFYAALLRYYTTTNLTPAEIHALGLREIERIETELRALLDDLGYQGVEIGEAIMRMEEQYRVTDPEKIVAGYQQAIDEIQGELVKYFHTVPSREFKVLDDPNCVLRAQAVGKGMLISTAFPHFSFEFRTTAFHETLPGHGLQDCLSDPSLSSYVKQIPFTVFIEGWATYAETLAYELGYLKEKESVVGYLKWQLIRAARLVVDTGIHYKHWSREEAAAYFVRTTGMKDGGSEVDRYIAWPGQACSYMVGQLKILEQREKARQALGEQFDIKEFHEVINSYHSIPMEVLEQIVDRYIVRKKENS